MNLANYTRTVLRFLELQLELNSVALSVSDKQEGMPAATCLLICIVADEPGITYNKLALLSGIPLAQVRDECQSLTRAGAKSYLRVEPESATENRVFLTEFGIMKHTRILANG